MFVEAYRYGRRLKSLFGRTLFDFVCRTWAKRHDRFRLDPAHSRPAPNIQRAFSEDAPCPAMAGC
jgi:hypothetical protein